MIVEVLHEAGGTLTCCDDAMTRVEENTTDAALEKHVPVIEKTSNGVAVKVGEKEHPMDAGHWIEWIEIIADGKTYRKFLNPDEKPAAEFSVSAEKITARAYCNLHGFWMSNQ